MIVEIVLISLLVLAAYNYRSTRKKFNLPPGPTGIPFVGNISAVTGRPYQAYAKWKEQFGDIFYVDFGGIRMVVLGAVHLIKECFNDPVFSGRAGELPLCILSQGQHGIVSSEGQEWVEQRRFTLRHLREFGFGKNSIEGTIMDEVNDFNSMLKSEEGNPVQMNTEKFQIPVLSSLWVVIAGTRLRSDDEHKLGILRMLENVSKPSIAATLHLFAPSVLRMSPRLLRLNSFQIIAEEFDKMFREIIKEHEDTLPDEDNPRDFIDAYLHEMKRTENTDSSFYEEAGVRSLLAVIGDMFFAGSGTTSSTLAWSLLYLAMNPDVQKKLQDEIDDVVGRSRQVSLADRSILPYAEATVQEVLRKSSIVVAGVTHTARQDATFAGYDIPQGTWIMTNIYAIHHDPKLWGDPHIFRPERFLSGDGKRVIKSENMVPFSLGKRVCAGENFARDQVFLFIANIFQRFSLSLDPSKPRPTYEPMTGFVLNPQEFSVIVKDRL